MSIFRSLKISLDVLEFSISLFHIVELQNLIPRRWIPNSSGLWNRDTFTQPNCKEFS